MDIEEPNKQGGAPPAAAANRKCILVLGMHRSGTSAFTRVFNLLGAELPKHVEDHWEPERLVTLHEQMLAEAGSRWDDWRAFDPAMLGLERLAHYRTEIARIITEQYGDAPLFVLKDPRICRFAPLYVEILGALGIDPRFVISLRNPLDVIASLHARDGMTPRFASLIWLRHVLDTEAGMRQGPSSFVSYERLLADWRSVMRDLSLTLGINWPTPLETAAAKVEAFLSSEQQHFSSSQLELERNSNVASWIKDAYQALLTLEKDRDSGASRTTLDKIRAEFNVAASVLGDAFFQELHAKEVKYHQNSSRLQTEADALRQQLAERDAKVAALDQMLSQRTGEIGALCDALAGRDASIAVLGRTLAEREAKVYSLEATISQLYASTSWRIAAPFRFLKRLFGRFQYSALGYPLALSCEALRTRSRALLRAIKYFGLALHGAFHQVVQKRTKLGSTAKLIKQGLRYLRANGLGATINRLSGTPPWNTANTQHGRALIDARYVALAEDARERFFGPLKSYPQLNGPTISILLSVFKTPLQFLEAAIDSVRRQIYPYWELCIVDDGSQSAEIEHMLTTFSRRDPRIKFESLKSNQGISSATNVALSMATGQFIGLLDHDDLLTCDALYQVAQVLEKNSDLDLIYSDECKVGENDRVEDIFVKPDWDSFLLLNFMYTGHFSVYRRSLIVDLGGFRSDFDFSQDYDLALRATEKTSRIHHIERILYGWRKAIGSAAAGDKNFARKSNIAALRSALERRHYGGNAVALRTGNRVWFDRAQYSTLVSIIVPSDNELHIRQSVESIIENSSYPFIEIIVVTRSGTIASLQDKIDPRVKFSAYDDVFNFSAKCNAGARISTGSFLVFFNDDVRVISQDWIECIIEYLTLESVGAVAPKLLYEDASIQHAGIVTGVRRLVGTAFHCLPSDSTIYFNLAQSVRNVSVLSGACLAVRREVFDLIGGFDADRYPIAHSDVDLCLKIRRANFQCVYTPFASLSHIGHASLKSSKSDKTQRQKDKADIHLLQDWSGEVARDPFWTRSMRDILYADSPENFEMFPPIQLDRTTSGRDILLVFHDLSNSGAPRILFEAARHLIAAGHFVVAISPKDGFYRDELRRIGAIVIIDELVLTTHATVSDFTRNFDIAIIITFVCWPFILQNASQLDCYWYLLEADAILDCAKNNPKFLEALREARAVWVCGIGVKALTKNLRPDMPVIEPGIVPPLPSKTDRGESLTGKCRRTRIGVFGSYEPRKGQDLAVAAIQQLPESLRERIELNFFGRILDHNYLEEVKRRVSKGLAIKFGPELTHAECREELVQSDLVLIPSRDDALSLVGLDAIGAGKIVVCSAAVGLSSYLRSGESAFIAESPAPEHLASAISEALSAEANWSDIGAKAQDAFNRNFTEAAFRDRILRALALS
jgi:GT2 family glycosyltransferase